MNGFAVRDSPRWARRKKASARQINLESQMKVLQKLYYRDSCRTNCTQTNTGQKAC